MQNLHLTFVSMYCRQKLGGDFEKCGLLRIYELYKHDGVAIKSYDSYFLTDKTFETKRVDTDQ